MLLVYIKLYSKVHKLIILRIWNKVTLVIKVIKIFILSDDSFAYFY